GVILKPGLNIVQSVYEGVMYNYSNSNVAQEIKFKVKTNFATLEDTDLFSTSRTLCEQLRGNVTTVVLSSTLHSSLALQSLFKNTNVPYVATSYQEHCSVNVGGNLNLPSADSLGVSLLPDYLPAVAEVVDHLAWDTFVYVYDSDNGPSKLQRLLSHQFKNSVSMRFAKRISNSSDANDFLRLLETTDRESRKYVLLDCRFETAKRIIVDHVRDIYMGRRNYHFLLVNPVVNELTYEKVPEFVAVNITALRLVGEDLSQQTSLDPSQEPREKKITVEEALIHDAATLIVNTYKELKLRSLVPHRYSYIFEDQDDDERRSGPQSRPRIEAEAELLEEGDQLLQADSPSSTTCGDRPSVPQELGEIITRNLRERSFQGLTGAIRFTSDGCRIDYNVHVVQLNVNNEAIAEWSDTKGFEPVVRPAKAEVNDTGVLDKDKTYVIQSVLKPYLMVKESPDAPDRTGNDRYDGYCKDLIDALARELDIKYELKAAEETVYGRRDHKVQGGWTGLIGQVLRKASRDTGLHMAEIQKPQRCCLIIDYLQKDPLVFARTRDDVDYPDVFDVQDVFGVFWTYSCNNESPRARGAIVMGTFCARLRRLLPAQPVPIIPCGAPAEALHGLQQVYFLERYVLPKSHAFRAVPGDTDVVQGKTQHSIQYSFLSEIYTQTLSLIPMTTSNTEAQKQGILALPSVLTTENISLAFFVARLLPKTSQKDNEADYQCFLSCWWPHRAELQRDDIIKKSNCNCNVTFCNSSTMNIAYFIYIKPSSMKELMECGSLNVTALFYCRKLLDQAIARLSETGELGKLKKKWWTEKSYCQYPERKKDETVMPLDNFIGVFFILGGGVALGILVGLIEVIYKCCTRSSAAKGAMPETTSTGEATIPEKEFAEQVLASA
ncbi:unnamed protein product, partial [Ixodes hexagonus]